MDSTKEVTDDIFYIEDYKEPLNISYDTSSSYVVKNDKLRVRFPEYGAILEFDQPVIELNKFRIMMFGIGQRCISVR